MGIKSNTYSNTQIFPWYIYALGYFGSLLFIDFVQLSILLGRRDYISSFFLNPIFIIGYLLILIGFIMKFITKSSIYFVAILIIITIFDLILLNFPFSLNVTLTFKIISAIIKYASYWTTVYLSRKRSHIPIENNKDAG